MNRTLPENARETLQLLRPPALRCRTVDVAGLVGTHLDQTRQRPYVLGKDHHTRRRPGLLDALDPVEHAQQLDRHLSLHRRGCRPGLLALLLGQHTKVRLDHVPAAQRATARPVEPTRVLKQLGTALPAKDMLATRHDGLVRRAQAYRALPVRHHARHAVHDQRCRGTGTTRRLPRCPVRAETTVLLAARHQLAHRCTVRVADP